MLRCTWISTWEYRMQSSSNLLGQRKAPLLQDAEVVFPNIHEECYFKEEAMYYLGEKVCFISRELTFSWALIRNVCHKNDRISPRNRGALPCKENPASGEVERKLGAQRAFLLKRAGVAQPGKRLCGLVVWGQRLWGGAPSMDWSWYFYPCDSA